MSARKTRGIVPLAMVASFAAGMLVDGRLRTHGPPRPVQDTDTVSLTRPAAAARDQATSSKPALLSAPPPGASASAPPKLSSADRPAPTAGTAGELSHAPLRMPIDGEDIDSLKGGFIERRGGGDRPHEAVDMLAPRNTPVHAVEDGTIAKLFTSKAGGLTIYQFDPSGRLCYYYAHLERYADGLNQGKTVSQGEVIGYVGTSGNAPPDTPHLHFAVFELSADKRWWQGKPLDPYLVFKNRG